MKIVVMGGSGFIGTNLIDLLEAEACTILNLDIRKPKKRGHDGYFKCVDLLDFESLLKNLKNFDPDYIVNLAARTDLDGLSVDEYRVNTDGVSNILECCKRLSTLNRVIFASTKLVTPTDALVSDLNDYQPDTLYGESKAIGEKIIESNGHIRNWIIVRPTSIWGPWSIADHIPYGMFFKIIEKGRYVHPAIIDQPRYFGYVENTCYQIYSLLLHPSDTVLRKKFYLADYEVYNIFDWANLISEAFGKKPIRKLPRPLVFLLAYIGDLAKLCGWKTVPFSSFRLKNMAANTTKVPLENTKNLVPKLPFSIKGGVNRTVNWIQNLE